MVTIKEVAARAGVPEKTAMRALSGRTLGVRKDARERAERVRKAAAELGYQPSAISRALRQGKTRTFGLLTGCITNQYYAALAETAMMEASRAGYRLLLELTGAQPERVADGVKNFLASRVDGILTTEAAGEHAVGRVLAKRKFPVMLFDTPSKEGFSAVYADYSRTIPAAVRHLAARGRRRITFLIHPSTSLLHARLLALFRDSCLVAGVEPEYLPAGTLDEMAGHAERRPEAVLIYGNYKLIRFLRRAAELPGYQPDAVGFFNPWSWHTRQPGLTGAILAPSEEMTRAAVRELIAEAEEQSTPRTIAFDTEFFPAEEFARIHAPDLNADFLPEE